MSSFSGLDDDIYEDLVCGEETEEEEENNESDSSSDDDG